MFVKALKQLEEGFALGTVGMIEYFSRYGLLKDRADEERKPVADKAATLWDGSEYSFEWLKAQPVEVILGASGPCECVADLLNRGYLAPRDILTMPWPRLSDRYLGPFAMAPREQVVNIDIFFEGFGDQLREDPPEIRCSVLNTLYPCRQEIADKAEFLWRTQQGGKSYVLPALEGSLDYLRKSYSLRLGNVEACADAALRLYWSGWPIHAFEGLTRSKIAGHAVKLNRKSEPKAKTYVWGYTYRPATGWIIRRASTNGVPERTVSGLIMTCEGGEPPEAILYAFAKARQADAYEITSVFIKEDAQ